MYRQTRSNNENLKNNMLLANELFNTIGIKLKIQYVTEYILICGIPKTMILKGC